MTVSKTIDIFATSRGRSVCRGCGAPIEWAMVVASGRKMCFDVPVEVVSDYRDERGRRVEVVDFTRNHWASCPKRDQFKRTRSAPMVERRRDGKD